MNVTWKWLKILGVQNHVTNSIGMLWCESQTVILWTTWLWEFVNDWRNHCAKDSQSTTS